MMIMMSVVVVLVGFHLSTTANVIDIITASVTSISPTAISITTDFVFVPMMIKLTSVLLCWRLSLLLLL